MQQADSAYLNIEIELKNDHSGRVRDELVAAFTSEIARTRHAMNQGVVPEEFQRLSKVVKSLEAAVKVTNDMWRRLQQGA